MTEVAKYLAKLIKAQLEGKIPENIPEGITAEEIEKVAYNSHLEYILLGALLKTSSLSESEINRYRGAVMRSIVRTTNQVMELRAMEKRFEEKKIKNQPMKGALLKFIYPTPEMREMSDIDILIAEEDFALADAELKDMGYSLRESIKHHDIYTKDSFMMIEAHRALYDKTVDGDQYQYFKNFSKAKLRDGCDYTYEFGYEDFYVYMMAHMAKHFYQTGCGVRHLVDIYVYLGEYAKQMNREYTDQELDKCGILTFTKHMEKLTNIWLQDEESSPLYDSIFEYMLDAGIYVKDENGIWNKFAQEEGEVNSKVLKNWYYFPPLYYMSEYYPYLHKHHWLLPWAWFVRGVNGLAHKKGVYKREMLEEIEDKSIVTMRNIYRAMGLKFKV